MRKTNRDTSIATSLHHLRSALRLICPEEDWSWLLMITKRIAAAAPHKPKKFGQVSSDQLYLLGIELMDEAVTKASDQRKISKSTAMQYRDGLLIALLAVIAVRRRTVTALRTGSQLVRSDNLCGPRIPPEDVKGKRGLEFNISADLPGASTSTSKGTDKLIRARNNTPDFGLQTKIGPCPPMQSTLPYSKEQKRPSDLA